MIIVLVFRARILYRLINSLRESRCERDIKQSYLRSMPESIGKTRPNIDRAYN